MARAVNKGMTHLFCVHVFSNQLKHNELFILIICEIKLFK